jgi:membrane associated rhomboid family serine protease
MVTPLSSAAGAEMDPLEDILRRCAAAAPSPWFPRHYAKLAGIPLGELATDVEFLWLEGLLRPASRPGDPVPGVTLTEAGARLLADPTEMAALCDGRQAVRGRDRAARRVLREVGAPVVSRVLVVVNLMVFGAGILIAMQRGAGQAFLAGIGIPAVLDTLHRIGSVSADDIVAGQWWRLLTAAFVHGSVLHLLMNMSMLAFGFGLAETMWGRLRYLLIYLIAAIGGNCVAMAWQPSIEVPGLDGPIEVSPPVVGASGALCGVMAAIVVWLVFNGRHLPRAAALQLRTSLIASGILLVFISLFPQVSGLCHLGGAIFGAAAATLLHIHRWKTGVWRLAALAGLVALPWLGLQAIDHERATDPRWHKVERRVFDRQFRLRIAEAHDGENQLRKDLDRLLKKPARKRDAGETQGVLKKMDKKRLILQPLADDLERAGPYRDVDTEGEREAVRDKARELIAEFEKAEGVLQQNADTPEGDDEEAAEFSRQFPNRIQDTMRKAIVLYRDKLQPLFKTPPAKRDPALVDKALHAVDSIQHELAELTAALGEAPRYSNGQVEQARLTAERYAAARTAQMEAAARCLRAAAKWTPEEEAALQKQADEVAALRSEWEKLLERQ